MKKKLIIAFFVFAAIGVGIFYLLTTGNIGAKYNTVEVKSGEVGLYVQDTGRISSKNIRRYYGNGASKVEEISLELGSHVEKGQLLVKFEDNLDLEIQKVEKQIEALEASYNDARSGTDMESISSARIEISRIKTLLETATREKERTEELFSIGAVSQVELNQAVNQVESIQGSLRIAQNTYNQLAKGLSSNVRKRYEAEIDVLLLTLQVLENNRDNSAIYSDVEGIVTELNTFQGDIPSPGLLMIEIQDPTAKVLLVDFMVEDAIKIGPDMKAEIHDFNLDLDFNELKVDQVYPKAFVTLSELGVKENRQTVEIELPKTDFNLAYGLEVETQVLIDAPREVLLVPTGAVFRENSKQYVKVLENGDLIEREITTGINMNGSVEVKEGLEEGELVLVNYQED